MIRREACWILSNMLAGKEENTKSIFSEPVIDILLNILVHDDFAVIKEAIFCVSNGTAHANDELVQIMFDKGMIETLATVLKSCQDEDIISAALEAMDNILAVGMEMVDNGAPCNPYLLRLEGCGGVKTIEDLQHHPGQKVYEVVGGFIEKYFQVDNT